MKLAVALSLSVAAALHAAPSLAAYTFQALDYPEAAQTTPCAVNDLGEIVGFDVDAAGATHAVLWKDGRPALVDPNGVVGKSALSHAYSVNALGVIAGSYADASGVLHGYALAGAKVTPVDYPNGDPTEAYGVNDLDQVIGVYYTPDGNLHAFELAKGAYANQDFPGALTTVPFSIDDRGEIVGYYTSVSGPPFQGYVREPDGTFKTYDFPGAPADGTLLISRNNVGETLGAYQDASGDFDNFLLAGGASPEPLALPASFGATSYVSFQTIDDLGEIVGFYDDASGNAHGFVARPQLF